MMTYQNWLACILTAVERISDRSYQEKAWFGADDLMSSPDEVFLGLMEDCTPELFFKTFGKRFTNRQLDSWLRLRSTLEAYYDKLPKNPDRRKVLNDPEWDAIRQIASDFLHAFRG